jgi:gliding motility-associated-like protein
VEDADYIWHFGDGQTSYEKTPNHKYEKTGEYKVELEIIKSNCSETSVLNQLVISDRELEIPNIFTPNNDGKNDLFIVTTPEGLQTFEALILSKNGILVYKWSDAKEGWDGLMMDGKKAPSGSYYYVIKGVDSTGKKFEYKSFLELSR